MKRTCPSLLWILLLASTCNATAATGAERKYEWVPNEILVKFKPGRSSDQKATIMQGQLIYEFRSSGSELWKCDAKSVESMIAELDANPDVEYVEPNYVVRAFVTPNDIWFGHCWGLHNTGLPDYRGNPGVADADIDAPEAWDTFRGSASTVVAIVDTGVDYNHPDLAANIWSNPGEIPGNGVDDDGNGYIDDIRGWDFFNKDADPMDDNDHGTHCAGIVGAVGNNTVGIAGVNWTVQIMGLKFLGALGAGSMADAAMAIEYATLMGVDVISASFGGFGYNRTLEGAIEAANAASIFFVAAAGNVDNNNDVSPYYPCSYESPNVVSVLATNNRDQRAVFDDEQASNYGATTVDIGAPGLHIYSTTINNTYSMFSGTSMAAPHVAGALALLRGQFPDIPVAGGRHALLTYGYDPVPALSGYCVTGGRLNVARLLGSSDTTPPSAVSDLAVIEFTSDRVTLSWTAQGDDGAVGTAFAYDVRYAHAPIITEADWAAASQATGGPAPLAAGTSQWLAVGGLTASTMFYFSIRTIDDYGNRAPLSNSPGCETLPPPIASVSPPMLSAALATGGSTTQVLAVANAGGPGAGVLDFTIPIPWLMLPPGTMAVVKQHEYVPLAKGAVDANTGSPVLNGAGGPDMFGYRWVDSDTDGGPLYAFFDISSLGSAVSLYDDANLGPYSLGITFPFYGSNFTTFRICSNGFVSLSSSETAPTNSALPAEGAPHNLLALFWDDLLPSSGGAHYYFDGTRAIIQYTNFSSYSGGGSYTMQMQLYPDGAIEYHYKTMLAPLNRATIGIQDASGTDGLTVAYNATYVHDNLAIRFEPMTQWLTVSPVSGSVAPGGSTAVNVTFNATGLCDSHYDGILHVLTNDPARSDTNVLVGLNVAGSADVSVSPGSLDFGGVYLGSTQSLNISVTNRGCSELLIYTLNSTNSDFSSAQALPLAVGPGATRNVAVAFSPSAAGPRAGVLHLTSSDPDTPTLGIAVSGAGSSAPSISIDPAMLVASAPSGQTVTKQLTISNSGGGVLSFEIPRAEAAGKGAMLATADAGSPKIGFASSGSDPDLVSPIPLGSGGPDTYGYRWTDSDHPDGPTYNWIEIAGSGTTIPFTGDEQNLGDFPIGFDFPFYGEQFSSFRASSNGWISFTNSSWTSPTNYELPSSSAPENALAPFWDNLTFATMGDAYYYYDGYRAIIEYLAVPRYASGGPYSFQVHLYPSGTIEFHYLEMGGTRLDEATIGIQNGTRNVGLAPAFNVPYVRSGMAIRFVPSPEWLTAIPAMGTVQVGGSVTVDVSFCASALANGTYNAILHILNNDPQASDMAVPVTFVVQDYASGVEADTPRRLAMLPNAPNPFNPITTIAFTIPARGLVDLRVFDVRGALVRTLLVAELPPGDYEAAWSGDSDGGLPSPSGIYLCRLRTAGGEICRRMTLIK